MEIRFQCSQNAEKLICQTLILLSCRCGNNFTVIGAMLSRRIINLLGSQHNGILCQKLRNFSHGFSPIKPGVLLVRSSIDVKIKAAAYTLNQPTCQAEVNLSSGTHTDVKTFYDKLNIEVTEHDSHNELKVDVPSSLAQESLCLNICIPHHYCKFDYKSLSGTQVQCLSFSLKLLIFLTLFTYSCMSLLFITGIDDASMMPSIRGRPNVKKICC